MTSKEKFIKAIEALDEVKSEISEVELKLYSLETTSASIMAVVGETNINAEKNNLRIFEAALQIANTSESKTSSKKEIDIIKSRISSYEQLESIISEKEELSKKYDALLEQLKECVSKYNKAKKSYESEISILGIEICGKEVVYNKPSAEIASEDEPVSVSTDEPVPEVTGNTAEENSESNSLLDHPMMGVLNAMSVYNDLYTYDTKTNGEKYSVAYSKLWKDVEISKEDESFISMLCEEDADIPGMTPYQVRKLVLSLPTELLKKIGREDIIEKRRAETKNYVKDGRNSWRSAFTYSVICDLAELVFNKVKAASSDEAKKCEQLIDKFMESNTDHLCGKVMKKCVRCAFCIVE